MSITLEDKKRTAIAVKLADMKATQNLLIANEQALIKAYQVEGFLNDDHKNLGIIDTVIVQYGIKAEPKPSVQKEIEEVEMMMQDSDIPLFEKVFPLIQHSFSNEQQKQMATDFMSAKSKIQEQRLASASH